MSSNSFIHSLFNEYKNYKDEYLASDFNNHSTIVKRLTELKANSIFKIEKIGYSVEHREIYSVVFGTGKTNILAWSQMHGDEPTATSALFDLLNFFSTDGQFNSVKENLLKNITFHFIPMLNPDGAEKFRRENAFNIDLNRDALKKQSYESNLLWLYAEKIKPEFGFNLHDQNSYYTAGKINTPTAISLLAPPVNHVKSINYTREKSMQLILKINETLSLFIPNCIARYKDDFEPRAFGDNLMKSGISIVLIESGFCRNDVKKEFVRKLNFIALISAFGSIVSKDYEKFEHTNYFDIPENEELLFDLLLRNLTLNYNGRKFKIDIGIKREKSLDLNSQSFTYSGKISELGDLSIFYGIEEYDFSDFEVRPLGKLAAEEKADFNILKDGRIHKKIINGFIIDEFK